MKGGGVYAVEGGVARGRGRRGDAGRRAKAMTATSSLVVQLVVCHSHRTVKTTRRCTSTPRPSQSQIESIPENRTSPRPRDGTLSTGWNASKREQRAPPRYYKT